VRERAIERRAGGTDKQREADRERERKRERERRTFPSSEGLRMRTGLLTMFSSSAT